MSSVFTLPNLHSPSIPLLALKDLQQSHQLNHQSMACLEQIMWQAQAHSLCHPYDIPMHWSSAFDMLDFVIDYWKMRLPHARV
jgi:hypothetical protein